MEVLSLNTTVISPVDETEKDLKSLDEISRELTSLNFPTLAFFQHLSDLNDQTLVSWPLQL